MLSPPPILRFWWSSDVCRKHWVARWLAPMSCLCFKGKHFHRLASLEGRPWLRIDTHFLSSWAPVGNLPDACDLPLWMCVRTSLLVRSYSEVQFADDSSRIVLHVTETLQASVSLQRKVFRRYLLNATAVTFTSWAEANRHMRPATRETRPICEKP